MQKYIKYKKEKTYVIDREDFHRHLRNAEAELNMPNDQRIQFWAKDGTHIGAISTDDIFGVGYPWLEDMQLLDDGSLLILLTQKRNDESANELMFFRLTGF